MKKFTIETIRSFEPCYDPGRHISEDWQGTIIDILDDKRIPLQDRLSVILRTDFVSEKLMRLFAVWCARQVQHLMKDQRSINALDVAEKFANGKVSKEELKDASAAARAAARAATWAVSRDAARHAARYAAWAVSRDAARAAARYVA